MQRGKKMERVFHVLLIFAIFQSVWTQSPTVTVNEGTLVGKTIQFSENRFINKNVDIDLFLVSIL